MNHWSNMTNVLTKKEKFEHRHAHRENTTWRWRQKWTAISMSQRTPKKKKKSINHQKLGERHGPDPSTHPSEQTTLLAPWSPTASLQTRETRNFCHWRHPVCGTLLQQPRQTHADAIAQQRFIHADATYVTQSAACQDVLCRWWQCRRAYGEWYPREQGAGSFLVTLVRSKPAKKLLRSFYVRMSPPQVFCFLVCLGLGKIL